MDYGSLAISSPVGYVAHMLGQMNLVATACHVRWTHGWPCPSVTSKMPLRHACGMNGHVGPLLTSTMISTFLKLKPVRASCEICRKSGSSGCSRANSSRSTPYELIDEITSWSSSVLLSGNGASIVAIISRLVDKVGRRKH